MNYHFSVEQVELNKKQIYPKTEIFLPAHGITLIIGSNGCGKTTLLNHILYRNSGSIAMIAQENDLIFTDLSVSENIMICNKNEELLLKLLEMFELNYLLNRNVKHISGGEKRIISLLRMFFVEQDIIFLDEPTNDLDYRTVETIKAMIAELGKQKSLLIVTHDKRLLSLAVQLYEFQDGEVIQENPIPILKEAKLPSFPSNEKITKLIRMDLVGIVLFLFVIISVICAGLATLLTENIDPIQLADEQTNIVSKFYANPDTLLKNGYVPIDAYIKYCGKVDLEYLNAYTNSINDALNTGGSLNMWIEKNCGQEVLVGMYINTITDQKQCIMQQYQNKREQQLGTSITFDGIVAYDGIYEMFYTSDDNIIETIDSALYQQVSDECMKGDPSNQPIIYIISGIDHEQIKKIDGNFFLKNKTSIEITKSVNSLKSFINISKILAIMLLGSIVSYFLYFCVNMKMLKKHIILMRNLGVKYDKVQNLIFNKRGMPIWKLLTTMIGVVICIIFNIICPEYSLVFILLSILCAILGITLISITHKVMKYNIQQIYCYEGIYDN